MGGRKELVVSAKTLFASSKHDIFEMGEKKRRARGAGRKSKKTGLREIWKAEIADNVCRGWYGVNCVQ